MRNDDPDHMAFPQLRGAPAYSRPPLVPAQPTRRPFDPDDMPLECERRGDNSEPARLGDESPYDWISARPSAPAGPAVSPAPDRLPFRLRLGGGRPEERDGGASDA